jgi:hypothetical protein
MKATMMRRYLRYHDAYWYFFPKIQEEPHIWEDIAECYDSDDSSIATVNAMRLFLYDFGVL